MSMTPVDERTPRIEGDNTEDAHGSRRYRWQRFRRAMRGSATRRHTLAAMAPYDAAAGALAPVRLVRRR